MQSFMMFCHAVSLSVLTISDDSSSQTKRSKLGAFRSLHLLTSIGRCKKDRRNLADALSRLRLSRQSLQSWRDALKNRMKQKLLFVIHNQLKAEEEQRQQQLAGKYANR